MKQASAYGWRGNRRGFLQRGAAVTVAACGAPMLASAEVLGLGGRSAPNSRIGIGMIGMGRQAYYANLLPFLASPDTQVVAVCDVDAWRAAEGQRRVEEYYAARSSEDRYRGGRVTGDYREVLADAAVDAVMISTPDHWHAIMAIEAARAGKDVALEKPISFSIAQGRAIAEAMTRYERVFRTDTEVRFAGEFIRLCEHVRNGRIGRVRRILVESPHEAEPAGWPAEAPVPEGLDYDFWLGPARAAPYSERRVHPQQDLRGRPGWMIISDTCDGIICNWGTHLIDIAQWGNDSERSGPIEIEGEGEFHPPGGLSDVLGSFEVRYRYADGVELIYRMTGRPAVRFEGDDGWIEAVWWKGLRAEPGDILEQPAGPNDLRFPQISEKLDFIRSIKSRAATQIPAEIGHRTNSMCQLGLISIQLGEKLAWDPERERFVANEAANRLLDRPLRAPWRLEG